MAPKSKTNQAARVGTPKDRHARLTSEINRSLSEDEKAALEALKNAGWQVLIQPRIEDCATCHGLRSFQAKGRYRVGVVRDRIMR